MSSLELKKLKAELLRVQAAKAEMEYLIEQRLDEIQRIQENVKKQEEAERLLIERMGT